MTYIIDHLHYQEFKKFLKFAKTKEDDNFKVILKVGIDIYNQEDKVAQIYTSGKKEVDVVVWLNTGFGSKRDISKEQKFNKAKEIYNKLKGEYKNTF